MSTSSKVALIREMLESAEASIRSAKQLLNDMSNGHAKSQYLNLAEKVGSHESVENRHTVEGVFDGQNMIGPNGKTYSVPANYASKSKLIPGDILKLTINDDGSFVYKQIGPAERKRVIGTITFDNGQYRIIGNGKSYKVLLASVTYFRGEIGDKVTLIVPELEESEWGAIENVLPKGDDDESHIDMEDLDI